ncbi:MAG: hypothetical protein HY744_31645 [Deltaproteobacteria bacterium]|nr:hypothetical protein [Deltaproteobacteria bacterium]
MRRTRSHPDALFFPAARTAFGAALAAIVALAAGCGAELAGESPAGLLPPGPQVSVAPRPPEEPEPWVLEWSGDVRQALTSQLGSAVALVRYQGGQLDLLPGCTVAGGYGPSGALGRARESKSIASESELFAELGVKIASAGASFRQGERWKLDFVVADVRSASERVSRAQVPPGCERATHYVRQIYLGAYELDTASGKRLSGHAGVGVGDVSAGLGGGKSDRLAIERSAGHVERCAEPQTGAGDPACAGLLKVGLAPLGP